MKTCYEVKKTSSEYPLPQHSHFWLPRYTQRNRVFWRNCVRVCTFIIDESIGWQKLKINQWNVSCTNSKHGFVHPTANQMHWLISTTKNRDKIKLTNDYAEITLRYNSCLVVFLVNLSHRKRPPNPDQWCDALPQKCLKFFYDQLMNVKSFQHHTMHIN